MAPENISETELINYVYENFSDIPTRKDAEIKLRTIRRSPTEPLLTYNVKYAAIHLVAMGVDPKDQIIESTWRNYANTLERHLANKLNKDIGNQKGCHLHNLQDVMDRAKSMEFKERTNRLYRTRKENDDATHIKEVNELDFENYEEINQLQKFEPRFNSTMKPRNNSFGSQSSGYQSGNNFRNNSQQYNRHPPSPNVSSNPSGFSKPNYSQNNTDRHDQPTGNSGFQTQVGQVDPTRNSSNSTHSQYNRSYNHTTTNNHMVTMEEGMLTNTSTIEINPGTG